MDLVEILATLTTDEGLAMAFIVGPDGLLVEGQSRTSSMDLESLGAMTTRVLPELERFGRVLAAGNFSQIRLRFDSYMVLIEKLPTADLFVAGISGTNNSERLLDAVARFRMQIQDTLSGL